METKSLTQRNTSESVYVVESFALDYKTKQIKTHTVELITKSKNNAEEFMTNIAFVAKTSHFGMLKETKDEVTYSCKSKGFIMKHLLGNYYLDYSNAEI